MGQVPHGAGLPQPAAVARVWVRRVPRQQPQQAGGGAAAAGGVVMGEGGGGCSDDEDGGDGEDDQDYRQPGCAVGRPPATRAAAPGQGRSGRVQGPGRSAPRPAPQHGHGQSPGAALHPDADGDDMAAEQGRGPPASRGPCVQWSCTLAARHFNSSSSFYLPTEGQANCGVTFQPYLDALRAGCCDPGGEQGSAATAAAAAPAGQHVYTTGQGTPTIRVAVDNRLQPQQSGPLQQAELRMIMFSSRRAMGEFYLQRVRAAGVGGLACLWLGRALERVVACLLWTVGPFAWPGQNPPEQLAKCSG